MQQVVSQLSRIMKKNLLQNNKCYRLSVQSTLKYWNKGINVNGLTQIRKSTFSTKEQSQKLLNPVWEKEREELLSNILQGKEAVQKIIDVSERLLDEERIEDCVELYDRALGRLPESSSLNCRLGALLVQLEKMEIGVEYISKGLAQDPHEMGEEGLIGLASVYKMLNRESDAIQTYQRSIELNYLPSYSHQFLALLYAEKNKLEQADHHFSLGNNLNPNDFVSQWAYGEQIFSRDQKKGIKIMQEAALNIASKPCDNQFVEDVKEMITTTNFRVGQIFQHIFKDPKTAMEHFNIALNNNPKHVESHVQLASCLKAIIPPNIQLADHHLQIAKQISPQNFEKKLTEWWQ